MIDKRLQNSDERGTIFNDVQMCSMTDPCILTTPVFRLIEGLIQINSRCHSRKSYLHLW